MRLILLLFILLTSCVFPLEKGSINLSIKDGPKKSKPIITNVKLENDLLKVSGSNFDNLRSVKLNSQTLDVVSNSGKELVLNAASSVLLSLDTVLSLVIDTAAGASTVNVIFNIVDNSITASKIADGQIQSNHISQMGAATGQFLQWDGSVWKPADISSLVFLGS